MHTRFGIALLEETVFASQKGDEALDAAIYTDKTRDWADTKK